MMIKDLHKAWQPSLYMYTAVLGLQKSATSLAKKLDKLSNGANHCNKTQPCPKKGMRKKVDIFVIR